MRDEWSGVNIVLFNKAKDFLNSVANSLNKNIYIDVNSIIFVYKKEL